jgi:hypothetical protein
MIFLPGENMGSKDSKSFRAIGFLCVLLVALLMLVHNTANQPFDQIQQYGWYLGLACMLIGPYLILKS